MTRARCATARALRAQFLLARNGLRATRQRVTIASLLFCGEHSHTTAEALYDRALGEGHQLSLATVYNTLHQFSKAGLIREIAIDAAQSFFDTNTSSHSHFYDEQSGQLLDIDGDVKVDGVPPPPAGFAVKYVDVVVRLTPAAKA